MLIFGCFLDGWHNVALWVWVWVVVLLCGLGSVFYGYTCLICVVLVILCGWVWGVC